jgi:ubiquitin-like-conjugating enzyme ATG3
LPRDKQFLVSRNLPCQRRAFEVEDYAGGAAAAEEVDADGGAGGGWLEARAGEEGSEEEEACGFEALPLPPALAAAAARDISAGAAPPPPGLSASPATAAADVPDISALALGCAAAGPAAAAAAAPRADEDDDAAAPPAAAAAAADGGGLRFYDAIVSYDKYHQVPRIYFLGYGGADRTPLSADEMLADVARGYAAGARKTVTVEAHPHVRHGGRLISVHPCQHAPVLRRLAAMHAAASDEDEGAEGAAEGSAGGAGEGQSSAGAARTAPPRFPVERALVLFLKFVAGVVPTVEYDFTMAA